ncbi:PH domain-containing protein [Solihabitans fulvus]|uniref:PH domain-containing protein n=1 Tax=Solihabitans fulvus TaxID=1892852 RepID=UPI001CB766CB|nr:PH domain-containing protein [Solihabitans fulvus]
MTARTWSPQAALVGLAWVLAAGALALALFRDNAPGRLLMAVATVCLGLLALHGTVARPRLTADETGLTVRTLRGARHWDWPDVSARLVHSRRLARTTAVLELDFREPDGEEHLVVLTRIDLGEDPEDVLEALRELRP